MIFIYIARTLFWVLRMIIPGIPKPVVQTREHGIDPKKQNCMACGNLGTLKMEYEVITTTPGKAEGTRLGVLKFTCQLCGAWFRTEPYYKRPGVHPEGARPLGPDEVGGIEKQGLPGAILRQPPAGTTSS